jgi:hypothetical protein
MFAGQTVTFVPRVSKGVGQGGKLFGPCVILLPVIRYISGAPSPIPSLYNVNRPSNRVLGCWHKCAAVHELPCPQDVPKTYTRACAPPPSPRPPLTHHDSSLTLTLISTHCSNSPAPQQSQEGVRLSYRINRFRAIDDKTEEFLFTYWWMFTNNLVTYVN